MSTAGDVVDHYSYVDDDQRDPPFAYAKSRCRWTVIQ